MKVSWNVPTTSSPSSATKSRSRAASDGGEGRLIGRPSLRRPQVAVRTQFILFVQAYDRLEIVGPRLADRQVGHAAARDSIGIRSARALKPGSASMRCVKARI